MPSRDYETEGPSSFADRPSVTISTSRREPEAPRRTAPVAAPVSPTETEFPSLFSPADSHHSQRTAASSIPSNDYFLIRGLEDPFGPKEDTEEATTITPTSSRLSYNPLRSPDRFLPSRNRHNPASLPFRLSRDPCFLSPTERTHRLRDPSADVFAYPPYRHAILGSIEIGDSRILPRHLPRYINHGLLSEHPSNPGEIAPTRRIRTHAVWTFQGITVNPRGPRNAVSDGRGGLLGSGTVAPLYIANFLAKQTPVQDDLAYESRLAYALDVDQAARVLDLSPQQPLQDKIVRLISSPVRWGGNGWGSDGSNSSTPKKSSKKSSKKTSRPVPSTPFRVLDAPLLRDDFYCSTLAYCYTARVLAVGLGHRVYIWSEGTAVKHPPLKDYPVSNHVTSLSFSSQVGGQSILAVARHGGQVTLWSTFDSEPRFEFKIPHAASNVCFKGRTARRLSSRDGLSSVNVEELVIGDERGQIWYYSVEWTSDKWRKRYKWDGAMTLIAKIAAHTQQICGIAWSPDGRYLATGGNDNLCLVFDTVELVRKRENYGVFSSQKPNCPGADSILSNRLCLLQSYFRCGNTQASTLSTGNGISETGSSQPSRGRSLNDPPSRQPLTIPVDSQKHKFMHAAAVKAIAFSPWQPTLIATGGGTNDRCIRFFHAISGACLAIINVHAQVTSLIWSKTRREIAATFGYASPEHPYRIAVFAWPSCQQVVAIPWSVATGHERYGSTDPSDCGRALWAISYPGGPNEMVHQLAEPASHRPRGNGHGPNRSDAGSEDSQPSLSNKEGDTWWSRTAEEGCIIVASSDESVKFHEVWSGTPKTITGTSGMLGGSTILESLEGIEKETEIIR
ncbi:hypothetical protein MaudCBS49596_006651 [Microsporum audouinii]